MENPTQARSEQEANVKERVRVLLSLLIPKIGIEIPEADWPLVVISEDETKTSSYNPGSNKISLHKNNLEDGAEMAEEVAHFIRCYCQKKNNNQNLENINHQMAVDEFFGRLGESIARQVIPKSEAAIFFPEPERKYLDHGSYEVLEKGRVSFQPKLDWLRSQVETDRNLRLFVNEKIKTFYKKLDLAQKELAQNINNNQPVLEAIKNSFLILSEGEDGLGSLLTFTESAQEDPQKEWIFDFKKRVGELFQAWSGLRSLITDEGTILDQSVAIEAEKIIKRMNSSCDFILADLAEPGYRLQKFIENAESSLFHSIGYAAAELYIQKNPQWIEKLAEIFNLSNEEIWQSFVWSEDFLQWFGENKPLSGLKDIVDELREIHSQMYLPIDEEV